MTNDEINRLLEISKVGDDLKNFKDEGGYALLEKHILTPFEQGAFEAFQNIPASDTDAVTMSQAMGKIIKKIRTEIDIKINEGKLAKKQLNSNEGDFEI
jgi:hypothetical protein